MTSPLSCVLFNFIIYIIIALKDPNTMKKLIVFGKHYEKIHSVFGKRPNISLALCSEFPSRVKKKNRIVKKKDLGKQRIKEYDLPWPIIILQLVFTFCILFFVVVRRDSCLCNNRKPLLSLKLSTMITTKKINLVLLW